METTPITCLTKSENSIAYISQSPNLCGYCYWKFQESKTVKKHPRLDLTIILRNIQAAGRKLFLIKDMLS